MAGLPSFSIVYVELSSFYSICEEVDYGSVVWFTLVHPVEPPDAIGACSALTGGKSEDT